jgi:hypothetical protein
MDPSNVLAVDRKGQILERERDRQRAAVVTVLVGTGGGEVAVVVRSSLVPVLVLVRVEFVK